MPKALAASALDNLVGASDAVGNDGVALEEGAACVGLLERGDLLGVRCCLNPSTNAFMPGPVFFPLVIDLPIVLAEAKASTTLEAKCLHSE